MHARTVIGIVTASVLSSASCVAILVPSAAYAQTKQHLATTTGRLLGGSALVVNTPKRLATHTGCVTEKVNSAMSVIEVTVSAKSKATNVTVGVNKFRVAAHTTQSRSIWVPEKSNRFKICETNKASVQATLLAHTAKPTRTRPGGVINVAARTTLKSSGGKSGHWKITSSQLPSGSSGVILEVSATKVGKLRVGVGAKSLTVAVGGHSSASTIIVPAERSLAWRMTSGTGKPEAVLLGYVSAQSNKTLGGARLHILAKSFAARGSAWKLAGQHGLPAAGSATPATSVIAEVSGGSAAVKDPLSQGTLSPLAVIKGQREDTPLRLSNGGSVSLTSAANATIVAWLSGDIMRTAGTVDLTQPGSPKPASAPRKGQVSFNGHQNFKTGETLLLGNTKVTPGGLIAVVDSVTTSAHETIVSFHKGGLLNAFDELDLSTDVPLTKPKSTKPKARSKQPADVTPVSGSISEDFSKSAGFTLGKNPSVSGSVGFDVHPSLSLSITVHTGALSWPTGVSIHYALDSTTTVSESLSASGNWSGSTTVPLGRVVLGGFDLGPVFVVPELSSSIKLSLNLSAQATIERSVSESAHVGMTLTADSHGISKVGDPNNGFAKPVVDTTSAPSFTASATATAALNFTFDLAIDGLAGPDASATAQLSLIVSPGSNPWWKVQASGDFSVGINLNALNLSLLTDVLRILHLPTDPSWTLGHLGPWTIASSGGALPPPSGGDGGSGSGGSPGSSGGGGGTGGTGVVGGSSVGPVPAGSVAETTGGPSKTWTDYTSGGGTQGPTIASNQTVGVSCKIPGLTVHDGNVWWYQVSSSPWNSDYFVSADAFFNDGQTAGSLLGTPFVDGNVPDCRGNSGSGSSDPGAVTGVSETTGGPANTWTDYGSAGGTAGPGVAAHQAIVIACRLTGFIVADGNNWWYQIASSPWSNNFYVSADAFYNNGATSGSLHGTPFVDSAVPTCGSPSGGGGGSSSSTYTETVGGVTHTWTDYSNAGGTEGPSIASYQSVQITCRANGFAVADGNTWWYQVASSPWSNTYWASADAYYNNGATSGSLHGTPFYDPAVPECGSGGGGSTPPPSPPPPTTYTETVGGVTHTWTNYSNAGGSQGPSIQPSQGVQITCRVNGFTVSDGNTWWYRIASSPWNNAYYASADAFYNNGATSGSLHGTPWYDPNVPNC